jgi:NAD(P)-dependent dehydrogenase (short-subunit alcohol dehydrogenase family)
MYNPFSLSEKTILVTGASSGIGKAIAIECSKMGAKLIITGRNSDRLSNVFNQLAGKDNKKIVADLTIENDIDILINGLPLLDGIVHCAGIAAPVPFQFTNREKFNSVLEINFLSPTIITQRLLKVKKIKSGASLVFISSISGVYCSYYGGSMYAASKGAINGLIKGMALDLSAKLIRVNSINPGMIETNILQDGIISEEQLKSDTKHYPLKRYGKPEEVAYAAIYLLSDASSWVTGSNLLIDGGYTLQ